MNRTTPRELGAAAARWLSHTTLALLALALLPVMSACNGTQLIKAPDAAFVQASRAMHDTVATEFVAYVQADENLLPLQKQNRVDAVGDWDFAIRQAEALLAAGVIEPTVAPPEEGGGDGE